MALVADRGFRRNLGTGKSLSFVIFLKGPQLEPFENNLVLFLATWAIAAFAYVVAGKVPSARLRRAIRVSAVFLSVPLLYLGHPFLYYQVWMAIATCITEPNTGGLAVLIAIWLVALAFADRKLIASVSGRADR